MHPLRSLLLALCVVALGCGSQGSETGGQSGAAGTGGSGGTSTDCSTAAELLRCEGRVLNIAHRGGRHIRPEHTLLAYAQALEDGADVLELDIHATRDGVLVVMHDDTVDRTTDGSGPIKEMSFEQLRSLDAGYRFTTDGGETHPYRDMGLKVPSLDEVLLAFPDVPYVIEIKQASPSIIDAFVDTVRSHGLLEQINGAAFDGDVLAELREAAPEMATSFSESEVLQYFLASANPEGLDPGYVPPAEFLQVPPRRMGIEVLHERFIPTAHALGLKVHVWTINDEDEMRTLIEDFGVDGIMTDDPPTLSRVIEETR